MTLIKRGVRAGVEDRWHRIDQHMLDTQILPKWKDEPLWVSTTHQSLDQQMDALTAARC